MKITREFILIMGLCFLISIGIVGLYLFETKEIDNINYDATNEINDIQNITAEELEYKIKHEGYVIDLG